MRFFGSLLVVILLLAGAGGCSDAKSDDDESSGTITLTVSGIAMEPTIKRGDQITVTKVNQYEPQRGEIVVFTDPGRWLAGGDDDNNNGSLVKRVIGLPGETVTCCDNSGRIAVNGKALDEPYIALPDYGPNCAGAGVGWRCRWKAGPVPAGHMFVLGDNRGESADSRVHMCHPEWDSCDESPWVDIDLVAGTVDGLSQHA